MKFRLIGRNTPGGAHFKIRLGGGRTKSVHPGDEVELSKSEVAHWQALGYELKRLKKPPKRRTSED